MKLRETTLEDVFISYTGRKIRSGEANNSKEMMRLRARMHGR